MVEEPHDFENMRLLIIQLHARDSNPYPFPLWGVVVIFDLIYKEAVSAYVRRLVDRSCKGGLCD